MNTSSKEEFSLQQWFLAGVIDLPWFEIIGKLWNIGRKVVRGLANEGIYEVLEYECKLELKDKEGENASVEKRELIRYAQDHVTCYQDQAWGDGKILLNYHCFPGVPVDEFRLGHNTYKLISLREFRNKGEIDEFNIGWDIKHMFLIGTGFWGTSINHRTRKITIKIVFPKDRPPLHVTVTEGNLKRTTTLGRELKHRLSDGRQMIIWEKEKPRLYEDYILKWEW